MRKSKLIGLLAEARAGHDRGRMYIILKDGVISGGIPEYVYVVDGKLRTVEKPKRKNLKHLRVIKDISKNQAALELREKLLKDKPVSNEEIKFALRALTREKGSGF